MGWCDEAVSHSTGSHVGYELTMIVEDGRTDSPATLQVLLAGTDPAHPRVALVLVPSRDLRHQSVVLTWAQVAKVADTLAEVRRRHGASEGSR